MQMKTLLIVARSIRHRSPAKLRSTNLQQAERFADALACLQAGR
jgi:hypothetical protein